MSLPMQETLTSTLLMELNVSKYLHSSLLHTPIDINIDKQSTISRFHPLKNNASTYAATFSEKNFATRILTSSTFLPPTKLPMS